MINIQALELRKLNFSQLELLVSWAQAEGWNPGPNDAAVYWVTDPDGFVGYYHDGELIAGGSVVAYGNEFGFMGFFIVKPEYRALGIGRKLWYQRRDLLQSRLHYGAPIGMDGVVDMQRFYNKGGFEIAYKDYRYEKIGERFTLHKSISKIEENDTKDLLDYDKKCFGYARPQFLIPWLKIPDNRNFKFVENDEIRGFAIVRKANLGYKICPLFADNAQIAEELYKACLNAVVGQPLYLDVPTTNEAAMRLAKKYNAIYVFECARMYFGAAPNVDIDKVFGITTFELG